MVGRRCLVNCAVRIAMPGEPVINKGAGEQGDRIETDREQHECIAECMNLAASQHRCDCHRTGRWMHAAKRKHQHDRDCHGNCCRQERHRDQVSAADACDCANQISTNDRPWLGQRACRYAEQQHGRRAQGRCQQRQIVNWPDEKTGNHARKQYSDQRAKAAAQLFTRRYWNRGRKEVATPLLKGRQDDIFLKMRRLFGRRI